MANANIAKINFAALADVLKNPTSCLPHMSLAAYLEMMTEGETRKHIEHEAAYRGCNPAGTNRILEEATIRAQTLDCARQLILLLVPHERHIKTLIGVE